MSLEPSNDAVRAGLMECGDDGRKPRDVRHYVYKSSEHSRPKSINEVMNLLQPYGFKIRKHSEAEGLILSHDREVASAEFDDLVDELADLMSLQGWFYDGWEALTLVKYAAIPNWPQATVH